MSVGAADYTSATPISLPYTSDPCLFSDYAPGTEQPYHPSYFTFTLSEEQLVVLDTLLTTGESQDTQLYLYQGSDLASATLINSVDDVGSSYLSKMYTTLPAGTYVVQMGEYSENGGDSMVLRASAYDVPTEPANNTLANAAELTLGEFNAPVFLSAATSQPDEPVVGDGRTAWWKFTAPTAGMYILDGTPMFQCQAFARYSSPSNTPAMTDLVPENLRSDIDYLAHEFEAGETAWYQVDTNGVDELMVEMRVRKATWTDWFDPDVPSESYSSSITSATPEVSGVENNISYYLSVFGMLYGTDSSPTTAEASWDLARGAVSGARTADQLGPTWFANIQHYDYSPTSHRSQFVVPMSYVQFSPQTNRNADAPPEAILDSALSGFLEYEGTPEPFGYMINYDVSVAYSANPDHPPITATAQVLDRGDLSGEPLNLQGPTSGSDVYVYEILAVVPDAVNDASPYTSVPEETPDNYVGFVDVASISWTASVDWLRSRWLVWDDSPASTGAPLGSFVDGDIAEIEVVGYWDGESTSPIEVVGWWDGSDIQDVE